MHESLDVAWSDGGERPLTDGRVDVEAKVLLDEHPCTWAVHLDGSPCLREVAERHLARRRVDISAGQLRVLHRGQPAFGLYPLVERLGPLLAVRVSPRCLPATVAFDDVAHWGVSFRLLALLRLAPRTLRISNWPPCRVR